MCRSFVPAISGRRILSWTGGLAAAGLVSLGLLAGGPDAANAQSAKGIKVTFGDTVKARLREVGKDPEAERKRLEDLFNKGLGALAPYRSDIMDLISRNHTIKIVCFGSKDAEDAKIHASAATGLDEAIQGALPAVTKGTFDDDGKPKKGATGFIGIECQSILRAKGFDGLSISSDGALLIEVLIHELLHAARKGNIHITNAKADLVPFDEFVAAVVGILRTTGQNAPPATKKFSGTRIVVFKGKSFNFSQKVAGPVVRGILGFVKLALATCSSDTVKETTMTYDAVIQSLDKYRMALEAEAAAQLKAAQDAVTAAEKTQDPEKILKARRALRPAQTRSEQATKDRMTFGMLIAHLKAKREECLKKCAETKPVKLPGDTAGKPDDKKDGTPKAGEKPKVGDKVKKAATPGAPKDGPKKDGEPKNGPKKEDGGDQRGDRLQRGDRGAGDFSRRPRTRVQ